ncbi:MAG: transferrin-binding protein-like solute binding protein, partial [Desulfobacterales bacterium]|nr:transferrin-binding protein-like solute binding protein [Desulfobacterales bacterium]
LGLGGKGKSAYVSDDHFASLITDGTGIDLIQDGGSYIYTAPSNKQFSDYVTWGYWGTAYKDASSDTYHLSMPNNFWIAGERTPDTQISDLIGSGAKATYKGGAEGIMISNTGDVGQLTGGSSNFDFDFGDKTFAGTITFDGNLSLSFDGGLSSDSFSDTQNNTHQLHGAFFGPNAEAIAGNFKTNNGTSNTYMGIFGGQR